ALNIAAGHGHNEIVELLLNDNVKDQRLTDVLELASAKGQENVVQKLLEKGANVNAKSKIFGTALSAA
ncbi:hypothetical protein DM02DRAFT_472304, partial [Periconia macrospinosa]